jgi:carbonic anhydrase
VAAAGLWTVGGALSPTFAKTTITADEAIEKLKAGNKKFVDAADLVERDMAAQRKAVAPLQSPWATILTCSDSRVSPELIFGGVGLGELFVARNAGGMADVPTIGTIEYGLEHLGSPLVFVIGHTRCGAVKAACDMVEKRSTLKEVEKIEELPGSVGPMIRAIEPSAKAVRGKPGDYYYNATIENAKRTAEHIAQTSTLVAESVHAGRVKLIYGYYNLDTGVVDFLG